MKPTPHPRMIPSTLAARCASAVGRLLPLMLALAIVLPDARALSPVNARNDPVKGYLNVALYTAPNGVPGNEVVTVGNITDQAKITATTAGINRALKEAYQEGFVLYFPSGTYVVNNTLKAHTATGGLGGAEFDTPDKSLVMIGEEGGNRPVIKLASNAPGFGGAITETSPPKAVVEFMNFEEDDDGIHIPSPNDTSIYRYFWEAPSKGYGQMIRNIIIDCSQSGNNKAIGLYFNQAQNSSIENVKVIATGALAGITGLPGRAWGAVNIEVVDGQYGIDTMPIVRPIYPDDPAEPNRRNLYSTSNSGSVVAGVKLTNQTTAAVRQHGFVPLVLVGFEITSNINQPIMTLVPSGSTGASAVNLIDGKITINRPVGSNTAELFNNAARKNLYISNVYVTGTDHLIKYGTNTTITATGTWKRIEEYSARAIPDGLLLDGDASNDSEHKECFNWLDEQPANFTPPAGSSWTNENSFEFKTIQPNYTGPVPVPANGALITKHAWALWQLPTPFDAGVVDVTNPPGTLNAVTPSATGMVNSADLQAIINNHSKVYMPKGIYRLNGPINLKSNTTLIGTARHLTRIEVHPNFPIKLSAGNPTETPIFTTVNDTTSANATTHLGDLAIGVDVGTTNDMARDWFVALHWMVGRNSMVHMGHPYRQNPSVFSNRFENTTNPHSLMKITNSGGGRWYFAGAVKTKTAGHPAYRILKVNGTNEPLWIYGLNPEHAVGGTLANSPATYVEFFNSDNIRIYAGKSEFENFQTLNATHPALASRIVWFNGCTNVGMYGHGAIRNGLINKGVMEFTDCVNVVATHITPQLNEWPLTNDHTVRDDTGVDIDGVAYPHVVALYKRGALTDALEALMTHN